MSKLAERLNENSQRVRENEKRVVAQLAFVERLQASGRSTRSAEEALEVMRRLLSDLYQTRIGWSCGVRRCRRGNAAPRRKRPIGRERETASGLVSKRWLGGRSPRGSRR
jgi:hypothetical protein